MTKVPHCLKFVTELDESHPTAMRFLQLEATQQVEMLESMLKDLIVPNIMPTIDHFNENGSWAILKVAE